MPKRDLFLEMVSLQTEIQRLFDEMAELHRLSPEGPQTDWSPKVDVSETPDRITVMAEMAGLAPEEIRLTVRDRVVTLAGERVPVTMEDGTPHRQERPFGKFEKRIQLRHPVNPHQAAATLRNGLLILRLPKVEDRRSKDIVIPIQTESE